ncbi:MAG TPA: hypothetical protein VM580_05195, partial [Labilithrix sp.]|nr:hypothetical protein [Labilithrix sp.]
MLEEAEAAKREAAQASARGNHARAAEIEERSSKAQIDKLLPLTKGDAEAGILVLIAAAEATLRASEYHAKAGSYARAADALDRVLQIHSKLGSASPHASELSSWRTKIQRWRQQAGSSSTGSSPSSSRPTAPPSNGPVDAVNRALELNNSGRTSEALVILDDALPKLDSSTNGDAALLVKANLVAARIYDDALLPSKAEARFLRAVRVAESSAGAKDKSLVNPLVRLGAHYLNLDEPERAAPHYMRAYDIAVVSASEQIAECIMGLARVVDARNDHKEAILLMHKARAVLVQNVAGVEGALTYM